MCGIVFAINKPFASGTTGFMRDALIASQVRGMDSTGIFQVDDKGMVESHKMPVCASIFIKNSVGDRIISQTGNRILTVGHVRAATHGSVSEQNAHPFKAFREDGSYIIGVHNGTLQGWKFKKDASEYEVDSHWAMHMLATEGMDAFEHFTGAFAFVWYDSRDPDNLYIAKNKERPLFYMISRDRRSILGSSELAMLGWVTGRNQIRLPEKKDPDHTPYYIDDGILYKFNLKDIGDFTESKFPSYDPRTTIARPIPHHGQGYMQTDLYRRDYLEAYGSRYNDDFYEDDIPFELGSRYDSRGRDATWEETKMENLLSNVKKALSIARWGENGDPDKVDSGQPTVVDEDALDRAMHRALADQSRAEEERATRLRQLAHQQISPEIAELIDKGEMFLTSVNSGSATRAQIEVAKDKGLYGMVVQFEGLEFDDVLKTELGTFNVTVEGETVTFDAEMRFMTRRLADDLYNGGKKGLAIVIGASMKDDKVDWVVVERPNADQLSLLKGHAQQFASAAVN